MRTKPIFELKGSELLSGFVGFNYNNWGKIDDIVSHYDSFGFASFSGKDGYGDFD